MLTWLGDGEKAQGWRAYLLDADLARVIDQATNVDPRTVRKVLSRYASGVEGLDRKRFVAVRQALLRLSDTSTLESRTTSFTSASDATARAVHMVQPAERKYPRQQLVRLMSASRRENLRRLLPDVEDSALKRILEDPALILYTEAEIPKAYQIWDGQLQGVHRADYNISAEASEPYGNGNFEFPWGAPAGTHRAGGVRSFRFLWLPHDAAGRTWPVAWYTNQVAGDTSPGYAWVFPIGTVIGEVLTLRAPNGYDYTFELRVRFRESNEWGVDVFRPFPTAGHLARRIRQLRPAAATDPRLARLLGHLETPRPLTSSYLGDSHPTRQAFSQTMGVDMLPSVGDDRLVRELLISTPFASSMGQVWRRGTNRQWTFAANTNANFHIVPANYDAGFIEVNRKSCMRCHETCNEPVSRFDYFRDWYGHVRGSDGIFSFHPFEPSSMSGNGFGGSEAMRYAFVQAGVVAQYDPKRHPASRYTRIRRFDR